MAEKGKTRTRVSKTASASNTARNMARAKKAVVVQSTDKNGDVPPLTDKEVQARMQKRANSPYSTTTFGFNSRTAYSAGADITGSSQGNLYSPQLSTDFLEKPQNLRERRAWYRHFYNANEFVGQAIDLHSTLPISKIKLDKPKIDNQDYADYIYDFYVDMCQDMKLTSKTLIEISHEFWLLGNCASPDSRVCTREGYKKIENINPGDLVLTHKGRWRKVTAKVSREAERLLSANIWKLGDFLKLTPEHPVEVLEGDKFIFKNFGEIKKGDYLRISYPTEIRDFEYMSLPDHSDIEWVEDGYDRKIKMSRRRTPDASKVRECLIDWLSNLKEPIVASRKKLASDFGVKPYTLNNVITQLQNETDGIFHRRIGSKGFAKGSRVVWYPVDLSDLQESENYSVYRIKHYKSPRVIQINEDFAYLVGYWVSDGTLARDNSRDSWGRGLWQIVFGEGSEKQYDRVYRILSEMLGEECLKTWSSRNTRIIKVKNPAFIEWWASHFGETSHGKNKKRIPGWFVDLPLQKLKVFLAGVIDSDGCIAQNGDSYIGVTLTSRGLIESIRDIGFKCGVTWTFNVGKERCGKTPQGTFSKLRKTYNLCVRDEQSCSVFLSNTCKQFPGEVEYCAPRYLKRVGGLIAYRVRAIEEISGSVVYNLQVEEDETFQIGGISTHNCMIFAEDHDPYSEYDEDSKNQIKEQGRERTKYLYEKFKIIDKDPNYLGFRQLIVLPPDQVRIKKIPLSDDVMIEFLPDPETKKVLTGMAQGNPLAYDARMPDEEAKKLQEKLPNELVNKLQMGGAIPLDTDPYSGSHVYHMARKKCQYETLGVSILERCINTLLLHDKLRQAQQSIASRHMTPIRIVWAEELSNNDVDNLREQVDLALVDPDFSIITNFQVNWEEMGSNGRLLELSSEYDHIENSLFAGLGVTREILTGEGTYTGNRITLEVLNTQYLLFRELLIDYIENNLFKPVARKKGFEIEDKFGRKKLVYPKVSFTRLAIRDNDAFFDQAFNMYNKGSLPVDTILDMMNIDPVTARKKIEADLFTVNDPAFNQLMQNLYTALGQVFAERYNVDQKIADYLDVQEKPQPEGGEEAAGGGGLGGLGGGMGRFSSSMSKQRQASLMKIMDLAMKNPDKLDKLAAFLGGPKG